MFKASRLSIKLPIASRLRSLWAGALFLSLVVPGCTTSQPTATLAPLDLIGIFPAANTIPGWELSQEGETYNSDNLFSLVDGQADSFFVYGFEEVAVQRYQNEAGILLTAEIWQLATHADAYGLFSAAQTGSPVTIGNAGDSDPGRRLAFWQNRYFVSLHAVEPVPDETLHAFAQAIAGMLPMGGEPPDIVGRLPTSGLVEGRSIFFHEEMSIQVDVWLGGENLLGLSQETNGVVGHYKIGDAAPLLMLIEFPTSSQAAEGLKALQSGSVSGLAASDALGNLLGAVFGEVDAAQAQTLLQEALK
jgi:hypothetical protein